VGHNKYSVTLDILDKNGKLISDLNSRVYMSASKNYIKVSEDYVNIIN
jgi:hypothetical protein